MRQSRMCPVCFLFGQLARIAEGVAALDGLVDEVEVLGLAVQDGLTDDLAVFGRAHFHHADERQGGLALTQVVADEVEAEEGGDEEEAGDEELPRGGFHGGCALLEHGTPTGFGFLYAQSEEAEEGFEHDHAGDEQGGVNHDDAEYVGDDVAGNDAAAGYACDAGGFDEFFVFEAEGLSADDAGDIF